MAYAAWLATCACTWGYNVPPSVSVIVVNWNGCAFLQKCLPSLAAQTHPLKDIVVVDNGSTDGSVAWLAEHFPEVRLVRNAQNHGFGAACNQGALLSSATYLAFLNNDAWAEPNWLAELVQAAEVNDRIGMVASKMLFADRPQVINSTGICVDRFGISWDRQGGEVDAAPDASQEVLGPCGGAALYRRAMFEELGGFDEAFFAYLEDVDLAMRARWRGWRAVYAPRARVYHAHSGTSKEGSSFKTYHLSRNKIYWVAKSYPMPHLLLCLPGVVFYEVLSQGYAVWRGQGLSALRGRLAGWGALPRLLGWRRRFMKEARTSAGEVWRPLEPARGPWGVFGRYRHISQRLD